MSGASSAHRGIAEWYLQSIIGHAVQHLRPCSEPLQAWQAVRSTPVRAAMLIDAEYVES